MSAIVFNDASPMPATAKRIDDEAMTDTQSFEFENGVQLTLIDGRGTKTVHLCDPRLGVRTVIQMAIGNDEQEYSIEQYRMDKNSCMQFLQFKFFKYDGSIEFEPEYFQAYSVGREGDDAGYWHHESAQNFENLLTDNVDVLFEQTRAFFDKCMQNLADGITTDFKELPCLKSENFYTLEQIAALQTGLPAPQGMGLK